MQCKYIYINTFLGQWYDYSSKKIKSYTAIWIKRQRIQIASNTEGCRRWCDGELPSEECALDKNESLTDATPPQKSMDSRSHTWKMCSWNQNSNYIFQKIVYVGNPKNEKKHNVPSFKKQCITQKLRWIQSRNGTKTVDVMEPWLIYCWPPRKMTSWFKSGGIPSFFGSVLKVHYLSFLGPQKSANISQRIHVWNSYLHWPLK